MKSIMPYRLRPGASAREARIERLESREMLSATGDPAWNLALFQRTTADSAADSTFASEATDGIVSNDSRWYSNVGSGGHWLEVELAEAYPVGSAQLFLGRDDGLTVASFEIQAHDGSAWQTVIDVENNAATDLNLLFPEAIDSATRYRFYTDQSVARIKEFVLLPPAADGSAHPLGTGVDLNLASRRAPIATSHSDGNYPLLATDGHRGNDSAWATTSAGANQIEFAVPSIHRVGSIQIHSGLLSDRNTEPLSEVTIEYANGSGWTPIPGGTASSGVLTGSTVTGNTSTELEVSFSTPVDANKVRLTFTGPATVREVVVLPANVTESGGAGYPIGVSASAEAAPTTRFATYGDDWYRLAARANNNSLIADAFGASQADLSTPEASKQYQLLYSYSLDAYRLVNREDGKALQVAGASVEAGAAIVEGDYAAAPHQLWRLAETDGGYFQLINVWSGMALQTDAASPATVTQQPLDAATSVSAHQQWRPELQERYFKKGTGGWVGQYRTGWAYDWARNDRDSSDPEFFYAPMQHREGWPNLTTLHRRYADWNNDVWPAYLMGFNEPDRPDQANMSVNRALELWPQLMAMDVPLLSPAPALGGEDWWLTPFMDQADNLGYRTDYAAGHWYSGPSVDNLLGHIDDLQNDSNGRRVWLTEFSVVDWSGGSGDWSEESNYNFILEFLWRAQSKNNLDKYAIFIFSGGSPTNPWDLTNPRSNFFSGGSLTPFGKAYAAWDGDTAVRDDTSYVIHNRNARHRLQNDGGASPEASSIRNEDATVQWSLRDAGGGKKHIVSNEDGRLLRYDGVTLDFAAPGTAGPEVEWSIQQEQHGWHNIVHTATGEYLRLLRQNDANNAPTSLDFQMVSASQAGGYSSTDWWFVKPWSAVAPFDPVPPEVADATFHWDSDQSVTIQFSEPIDTDTIDLGDFTITHLNTGDVFNERDVDVPQASADGFTITMKNLPLADGEYRLDVHANGVADGSGNGVLPFTTTFSVLTGDADQDGRVDDLDRSVWSANYGSATDLRADWNRDGQVDAADYTLWRDNRDVSPAPAAVAAAETAEVGDLDLGAAFSVVPATDAIGARMLRSTTRHRLASYETTPSLLLYETAAAFDEAMATDRFSGDDVNDESSKPDEDNSDQWMADICCEEDMSNAMEQ